MAAVLVALALAAMYWWLFVRNTPMAGARKPGAETVAAAPAPVVAAPVPVATSAPTFLPPPSASVEPPKPVAEAPKAEPAKATAKSEPAKAIAAKAEPVSRPVPPKIEPPPATMARSEPAPSMQRVSVSPSGSTLKFRFKGKSWVEIRDAGGEVLLSGINDAGSEAEVVGKPPFKVVVGNAPEVRMFFNEREFNLAPHMREAVARVTVE
jgi:cytoskeleton protein RodZ